MSKSIWQKLGPLKLIVSPITLKAYDRFSLAHIGFFQDVPIELFDKTVLIDIEVLDAQLDYNNLLGCSYMYAMTVITSSIFCVMMFPHRGNIVTMDKLICFEKKTSTNPDSVLPFVVSHKELVPYFTQVGLGMFKESSLLDTYPGYPPLIELAPATPVCMMSLSNTP